MLDSMKFWLAKTLVEIGLWSLVVIPLVAFMVWQDHKNRKYLAERDRKRRESDRARGA